MTTLTKEGLTALIALQEKDKVVDKLKTELKNVPSEAARLKTSLEEEKGRFIVLKEKVTQLQLARKQKEGELVSSEEAIQKHHLELNKIKSNEAYKALLTEIESDKTQKTKLEDEILNIFEELDGVAQQEKKEQQVLKEIETQVAQKIQELESKKQDLEKRLATAQTEREAMATQVSSDVLGRYDQIRSKKNGVALVPVRADNCGGCHMTLTPQTVVNVKKGQGFVVCDNCQRILYLP
ncbi:MAG: hypothetical protein HY399_00430 [Elusimicrobia bacterium]|nr:hypothetical protein [Elusimicrobiota bacterium]